MVSTGTARYRYVVHTFAQLYRYVLISTFLLAYLPPKKILDSVASINTRQ